MSNIMNMKDVRNHVHRSGFDMSFRNCFTAKVGEILPVSMDGTLPGDKWKIDLRQFMRSAPVQTATYGRVRQYYDWYFVPLRLLWDKFPAWIVQTKNSYHAKDIVSASANFASHPYFTGDDIYDLFYNLESHFLNKVYNDGGSTTYYGARKLLSYLGYGMDMTYFHPEVGTAWPFNIRLNPFPLLAYQKIYQDWFRFAQWEDASPWVYNLDYVLQDNQLHMDFASIWDSFESGGVSNTFLDLRYCNYDKDLFLGLLPAPQYGDTAIAGPLSGSLYGNSVGTLDLGLPGNVTGSIGNGQSMMFVNSSNNQVETISDSGTVYGDARLNVTGGNFQQILDARTTAGLSVLLLRQAEMRQKWAEITMSGSPDYKEQIQKHWNVLVSDSESYRCKYLGGVSFDVDVSEVINTNLDAESSEASIAGKGVSAGNGHIEFDCKDYGILMCVYHAKPLVDWKSGHLMMPYNTMTYASDYPIPEFDNVGMESIQAAHFMNPNPSNVDNFIKEVGYAPRYINWKTKVDVANGGFEHSLSPWVIPHWFESQEYKPGTMIALNYDTFKVKFDCLDGIFGVNAFENDVEYATDHFYNTAYFKASVVRNLSRDGLPY